MEECYDRRVSIDHDVWHVVPRPEEKSVVTSKWIYNIKHDADGSIEKYKAIFDEDTDYNKSRKRHAEEPEESEAPRIHDTTMNEETQEEDREFEEP